MKAKTFDCVEMKRKAAAEIYEETKGMTPDEELAYWQERNRELREWQKSLREKTQSVKKP